MDFTPEQTEQLDASLDGARVKERAGFSYIEGWWAVREANRIFGHGAWSHQIVNLTPFIIATQGTPNYHGSNNREGYLIAFHCTVRVTVGDQSHDGVGYGEGIDYNNCGQALESAVKEAETDAMKRALKNWGNPFGLALYDKDQVDVERAPADKGHGYCTLPGHNNAPFSQSDKQRELGYPPSHKQGDGWCSKKPETAPAQSEVTVTPKGEAYSALDRLIGGNAAKRGDYIKATVKRDINHPDEVTDNEWILVKEAAMNDLAAQQYRPEGDPAAPPLPGTDVDPQEAMH